MGSPTLPTELPAALADHSRFVQRIRRRYADELARLPAGLPDFAVIVALIESLRANGRSLPQVRVLAIGATHNDFERDYA